MALQSILGDSVTKPKTNVLAYKLSEIRDIPRTQKLAIFGAGSLVGEEDILKREKYSCTLTCVSTLGTLYRVSAELFELLRMNDPSMVQIASQATKKESWIRANYIKALPRNFEREDQQIKKTLHIPAIDNRDGSQRYAKQSSTTSLMINSKSIMNPQF